MAPCLSGELRHVFVRCYGSNDDLRAHRLLRRGRPNGIDAGAAGQTDGHDSAAKDLTEPGSTDDPGEDSEPPSDEPADPDLSRIGARGGRWLRQNKHRGTRRMWRFSRW